jgi:hypothetical protein
MDAIITDPGTGSEAERNVFPETGYEHPKERDIDVYFLNISYCTERSHR